MYSFGGNSSFLKALYLQRYMPPFHHQQKRCSQIATIKILLLNKTTFTYIFSFLTSVDPGYFAVDMHTDGLRGITSVSVAILYQVSLQGSDLALPSGQQTSTRLPVLVLPPEEEPGRLERSSFLLFIICTSTGV